MQRVCDTLCVRLCLCYYFGFCQIKTWKKGCGKLKNVVCTTETKEMYTNTYVDASHMHICWKGVRKFFGIRLEQLRCPGPHMWAGKVALERVEPLLAATKLSNGIQLYILLLSLVILRFFSYMCSGLYGIAVCLQRQRMWHGGVCGGTYVVRQCIEENCTKNTHPKWPHNGANHPQMATFWSIKWP